MENETLSKGAIVIMGLATIGGVSLLLGGAYGTKKIVSMITRKNEIDDFEDDEEDFFEN